MVITFVLIIIMPVNAKHSKLFFFNPTLSKYLFVLSSSYSCFDTATADNNPKIAMTTTRDPKQCFF